MADTYDWTINDLVHEASNGVVITVHWNVSAVRPNPNGGDEYYAMDGGGEFINGDPKAKSFIPYGDLKEATCIEWVKNILGPERVSEIEAGLTSQLDAQANPPLRNGMPWNTREIVVD